MNALFNATAISRVKIRFGNGHLNTLLISGVVILPDNNVAAKSVADRDQFLNSNKVDPGQLEFAALMRKIDKIDPSYRD